MPWLIAFLVIALVLLYVFLVRPVLVHAPVLSAAFKAEADWIDQLRAKLAGWKTKLASRFVLLSGLLVGLYDTALPSIAGQDWTPVTAKLPTWSIPVGLFLIGWLFSYLRKVTENPPQVITQRMDDGTVQVVGLNKPGA